MKALSLLIAEDESIIRLDLKEMLEAAGHCVCANTGNGKQAVRLAKRLKPDLAILDVMMPGLDGIEVARVLYTLNIPTVLLTAYSQPKYINRAEKVFVYGYLVKPVKEKELLPALQIAYARWQEMQAMRQSLSETKNELQNQKFLARAKAILALQLGISEYEAHQYITRLAMDRRITLMRLAEEIIQGNGIIMS